MVEKMVEKLEFCWAVLKGGSLVGLLVWTMVASMVVSWVATKEFCLAAQKGVLKVEHLAL